MSEDKIPQKTFMSEAKRKLLRRENETPEERAVRQEKQRGRQRLFRQTQFDQEPAQLLSISENVRLPSEKARAIHDQPST